MVVAGTMSLTRASVNSRFAACNTATPETIPHGSGPLTVSPDIRTCAPCATRTIAYKGLPLRPTAYGVSAAGDLTSVAPAPAPWSVRSLPITSSSVYVPLLTLIVSPGAAASTAAWIVG